MVVRYMLLLVLVVLLLPAGASATFLLFSDRGAWEAAASSAGLDVETQDFASDPGIGFELGGADFAVLSGIYNTSSQDVVLITGIN